MGAGRSPANYGFGHLPDFEFSKNLTNSPKNAKMSRIFSSVFFDTGYEYIYN